MAISFYPPAARGLWHAPTTASLAEEVIGARATQSATVDIALCPSQHEFKFKFFRFHMMRDPDTLARPLPMARFAPPSKSTANRLSPTSSPCSRHEGHVTIVIPSHGHQI